MKPLIVFTGQGVARADGFNLLRRLRTLPEFAELARAIAWRDRLNLDELFAVAGSFGGSVLDDLVRATRTICLKERRATARKATHRAVFECLAEVAKQRLVVHLTSNVDGLTSTVAVRDYGAAWPPFNGVASLAEIDAEIAIALQRGRGLLHLPVHGEAALIFSIEHETSLRTFYGDPLAARGNGTWHPTLRATIGADVRRARESFPIAATGFSLLRSLVLGESIGVGGAEPVALRTADLVTIGYGAASRSSRALYPFESCIDELRLRGAPAAGQSFVALLHEGAESVTSAAWYRERGFVVTSYAEGEMASVLRHSLVHPRPSTRADVGPDASARFPTAPLLAARGDSRS